MPITASDPSNRVIEDAASGSAPVAPSATTRASDVMRADTSPVCRLDAKPKSPSSIAASACWRNRFSSVAWAASESARQVHSTPTCVARRTPNAHTAAENPWDEPATA